MKQSARVLLVTLLAAASATSVANEVSVLAFSPKIELQMSQLKAEAIVGVSLQIERSFKQNSSFYLGEVTQPAAEMQVVSLNKVVYTEPTFEIEFNQAD